MTSVEQTPADPNGQPQAEAPSGTQGATAEQPTQPSGKDERHFSRKINEINDEKYQIAKDAVSLDPDYIYRLAERDQGTANRLLRELPEYGATDATTLLDARAQRKPADPIADTLKRLDRDNLEAQVREMKEKHPEFGGDWEQEFRRMYSDPAFTRFDAAKKVEIARAVVGETPQTKSAQSVALDILKNQQGAMPSVRGAAAGGQTDVESPEERKVRQGFGHTEDDLKKYLPENIDDFLL